MKKYIFLQVILFFIFNAYEPTSGYFSPQRIISLGPYITEEIYLLDAQDKLVGCTIYCQRPSEAQKKEKVGTVIQINIEKILTLKPDLVIATSLTQKKDIEKLKNLGIRVIKFSSPKNFFEICSQFLELGRILGKYDLAEKIVQEVKSKVLEIKRKTKDLAKVKVFVEVGTNPLFTITKDSFLNDFIEFSGGINIAKDAKTGIYSREAVLKENPDVIIIATMGILADKEKEIWGKYKNLEAVKNNRIYIMDAYKLCSPTPVSFLETLEELVNILHK
jgi:iron complex transport system substrate-binding protein